MTSRALLRLSVAAILALTTPLRGVHAAAPKAARPVARPAPAKAPVAAPAASTSAPAPRTVTLTGGPRTLTTADVKPVGYVPDPKIPLVRPSVSLSPAQQAAIVASKLTVPVDLSVVGVTPVGFKPDDVQATGQWLTFNVHVKNAGPGRAVRVEVKVAYQGSKEGWPMKPGYLAELKAGHSRVVSCQLFVPETAYQGGHTFRVSVDERGVNKDTTPANNKTHTKITVVPVRRPDLTINSLESIQTDKANDYLVNDAYIQYKWRVGVRNDGTEKSPVSSVRGQVYKLSDKAPALKATWNMGIPPIGPQGAISIMSPKFTCPLHTTHEFVFTVDPDDVIRELLETNNERRANKSIDHKHHGLKAVGAAVSFASKAAISGVTALGEYVWEGIKSASIHAVVGVMWGGMIAYVASGDAWFLEGSRALTAAEREPLRITFPDDFLAKVRVAETNSMGRLEFHVGGAAAVTYPRVIVFRKGALYKNGKFNVDLVAHELVHSYQYQKYGLSKFCWDYLYSFVTQGFSYEDIEFERQARLVAEDYFEKGTKMTVGEILGY